MKPVFTTLHITCRKVHSPLNEELQILVPSSAHGYIEFPLTAFTMMLSHPHLTTLLKILNYNVYMYLLVIYKYIIAEDNQKITWLCQVTDRATPIVASLSGSVVLRSDSYLFYFNAWPHIQCIRLGCSSMIHLLIAKCCSRHIIRVYT